MSSIVIFAQKNKKSNLDSIQNLDEVIIKSNYIFGSKFVAKNRTGSAYYISPKDIEKLGYTDINRLLKTVPGVNIYEEDGFGLRPNISLRGTSPERSAKITLMEDGILIAPAPYSASSAYYFPTIARMSSVEVLKGSSQVQYGPFTTGGAINMISTEIPESFHGKIRASYGSYNSSNLHALVGNSNNNFGYVIEYLNYGSKGFKDLLNDLNTGFNKNDFVAKVWVNLAPNHKIKQSIELKYQYSDEKSNETYLGLTDDDFSRNPFSRYTGSAKDLMTNKHNQYVLTHTLDFTKDSRITTNFYLNKFKRNWYKSDYATFNGNRKSNGSIFSDPIANSDYIRFIKGEIDSDGDDYINVRANNRKYVSQGIQTKFDHHWSSNNVFHDLEIGVRYHYDEEDRFQWIDDYSIVNNEMIITNLGTPGSNANRISSAKALATFISYKLKFNNWTFTPGLRYENIKLYRDNFGSNDSDRTGKDLSSRKNSVSVFIPGIGFNYKFDNRVNIFGGVHKGFSPPGNQPDQKPEESINYELGSRFVFGRISGELVGFYNDYSNLLGSDVAATGGTGSLDQFNAGEVSIKGLEFLINVDLLKNSKNYHLPVQFGYTYTDTEFKNSFDSDDSLWGEVNVGDELPYISKHQFNIGLSLEHKKFELNLNGRMNGKFRTQAGSGSIPNNEKVGSNFIIDFTGKYHMYKNLSFTANIINLLDKTYAVSRVPAGLRPGHPFGAYAGLEFKF